MDWDSIDKDLTTPAFFAGTEFHETFALLRKEDPVHWTDGDYERGFWTVTRHEDCKTVLNDAETFSSTRGTHLPVVGSDLSDQDKMEQGVDRLLPFLDAPDHPTLRRPVNKYFSVPAVSKMRDEVEEIVGQILAEVGPTGKCEVVNDVVAELPARLFLGMMNVPREDWPKVRRLALAMMHPSDPSYQLPGATAAETWLSSMKGLHAYLRDLGMSRRENPLDDDFTTVIAHLEINGELLTADQLGWYNFQIVGGGLETTRNAGVIGLRELMLHSDQAQFLRDNPEAIPGAVEEIVRWVTPSKNRLRVATKDTVLGGKQIKKGDWVVAWVVSANRDDEVFGNGSDFDVRRAPTNHFGFGEGPHLCLGRNLARLELAVLIERFLDAFPDYEQDGPVEWVADNNTTALKSFPIKFTPREVLSHA